MTAWILALIFGVAGFLIGRRVAQLERDHGAEVTRLQRLRDLTRPEDPKKP